MEYRTLGKTGLRVSAVGCGTWEIGGREWGAIGEVSPGWTYAIPC